MILSTNQRPRRLFTLRNQRNVQVRVFGGSAAGIRRDHLQETGVGEGREGRKEGKAERVGHRGHAGSQAKIQKALPIYVTLT